MEERLGVAASVNDPTAEVSRRRRRKRSMLPTLLLATATLKGTNASGLCIPEPARRAYVTTLSSPAHHVLGARVLAQSLREAQVKADVVVLVSAEQADAATVAALQRDGLLVLTLPTLDVNASSSIGGSYPRRLADAAAKVHLWSLTQYDRIVYMEPHTMVTRNADALFACEGFCAVMPAASSARQRQQRSAASERSAAVRTISTDVMVLEPSAEMHQSLLRALAAAVQRVSAAARSTDTATLLAGVLALDANCPTFEDLDDFSPLLDDDAEASSSSGSNGGSASQGSPILVLNADHMPACAPGGAVSAHGTCRRLPYTYAAPSEDYHRKGAWQGAVGDRLGRAAATKTAAAAAAEPHIVKFAARGDSPWQGLSRHPAQPLFWRWHSFREQLQEPYSGATWRAALAALLLPCALLAAAHAHYKWVVESSKRRGSGDSSSSSSGSSCLSSSSRSTASRDSSVGTPSPLERRFSRQHCHDVLPTVDTPEAAHRVGAAGRTGLLHNASLSLRVGLCTACAGFAKLWFAAAGGWVHALAQPHWHPAVAALVRHAWLACALTAGLHALDFAYFLWVTRARTLRRDAAPCALLLAALLLLSLHDAWWGGTAADVSASWPAVLCASAIAVGLLLGGAHSGRARSAALRLSSGSHLAAITGACAGAAAVGSLVTAAALEPQLHAQLHGVLSTAHLAVSAGVYCSLAVSSWPFSSSSSSSSSHSSSGSSSHVSKSSAMRGSVQSLLLRLMTAAFDALDTESSSEAAAGSNGLSKGSSSSSSSSKHRSRSAASLLRLVALHLVKEHWNWLIAGAALVWVVATAGRSSGGAGRTAPPHYRVHSEQCLYGEWGYASAAGRKLAPQCGAAETFKPIITASGAVCLRTQDGRFMTPLRGKLLEECAPESQFVFQAARSSPAMGDLGEGGTAGGGLFAADAAAAAAAAAAARSSGSSSSKPALTRAEQEQRRLQLEGFCAYNAATGLYLSASSHPQPICRLTERWRIKSWTW